MTKKKVIIAAGGTGGHIFPAYSLANYLAGKNFNIKIITDDRGFYYLKSYKKLDITKISSTPIIKKNIFKIISSLLVIFFSILKSIIFLVFNRPTIIFGMGGYSSFPICLAALLLRIKFIIYENNLVIGKANKVLLPFTNRLLVSYKEVEGIPKKYLSKTTEIGNILREEIVNPHFSKIEKDKFEKINILVLGGSQAAKTFAEELPEIFKKLQINKIPFKVFQQCRNDQIDQLTKFYKDAEISYEIFNFTNNIINYYSKTNLVITRAGASVLAELINFKLPFITIPLPTSADNHQYKNAEFYVKKGYGYLLDEKDIKNKLYNLLYSIISDKTLIKKILINQKKYSDKNVFKNLNNLLDKILNEKN